MSAWCKCKEGHRYLQYDIPSDDVQQGAPACPECRAEWYKTHLQCVVKLSIKPGDALVVRVEGVIPAREVARINAFFTSRFPDVEVIVLQHGMQLAILERPSD